MARISTGNLIPLLRRVAIATHAGVDARTTWRKEAQQGPAEQRRHLAQIRDAVERGETVAKAMAAGNGFFPPLVRDMVDVGEQTGSLDLVLQRLVEHYEHLRDLKRTFLQAIIWPALQLAAALAIVGFLIWILGVIGNMNHGQTIDILGLGLVGNRGLAIYLTGLATIAALIGLLVFSWKNGRLGNGPVQLAMATPLLGKLIQTFCLARFSWTLSLALGAGADARHSLRMALRSTQNPLFTTHLQQVDKAVLNQGVEMHEALRLTGVFPDDFLHSLESAELAGAPVEALEKIAQDYQKRSQALSKTLTIFAAIGVGLLVAALIIALIFRLAFFYIHTIYDALNGI